jgi:acetoacetyl-CoA synthetase
MRNDLNTPDTPLWTPRPDARMATAMGRFFERVKAGHPAAPDPLAPYAEWHRWSVENPAEFWAEIWQLCDIVGDFPADARPWLAVLEGGDVMQPPARHDGAPGPRWFRGARLNYTENVLRFTGDAAAIIATDERGRRREVSRDALRADVARIAAALRAAGIRPGDRVAAFLPNIPEAVIAALATVACGAIWSSCSPDFGTKGVLDRFGQIEPRVLFVADGYTYAGKTIDCLDRAREIAAAIPGIEQIVVIPFLGHALAPEALVGLRDSALFETFASRGDGAALTFDRLPFDHPLYIMYSSGTTGLPKCLVHGAGGTLLQIFKEHRLHVDLGEGDRIFYFTTCGWMMWNWLVNALATGATIVLYDGAPMPPAAPMALWQLAADERVQVFGTSAKFIALSEKEGMKPAASLDLSALQTILSTGSPLAPAGYDYVERDVRPGVHLGSISGGTDIISCFALANPLLPVWRGELQSRGLGMAVDIFDADGAPLRGAPGELVCTRPFPSMPVAFWNDPDGAKYRAAYFDFYSRGRPGVWRHGDWAEITAHDGLVIHGRSDATLNPGGVRIGTAEIYRQVDEMEEIVESVVIGQEQGGDDVRVVLFVRMRDGFTLDDPMRDRIRRRIREQTSSHHVPRVILAVEDIPRTISGKITELAVRDVVHGREVRNTDALANPHALTHFRDRPELRV